MKRVFVLFLAWCVLFQSTAVVVASAAPEEAQKEQIVLLPIRGQGMTDNELSLYRDAAAQGLSEKYSVKYGEQVDKVIQDIFSEESKSGLECDESRCYRDIATMLNVKFIAKATIIPRASDYQISMVVYNVYENKSVMSKVDVCEKCSSGQLLKKLVAMAANKEGEKEQVKEEGGSTWYWWVLGVLVAGGAAAALGGGKSDGGGGGPSPGTYTVHW